MKNNKILLVDDDPDDRFFFIDALREIDMNVHCREATNGFEALNILHTESLPDILFLDLNMPIMNGFECLIEIKRHKKLNKIPVIIYTTGSDPSIIKKTHENGATAYLKKPNDYAVFINKLNQIIKADYKNMTVDPLNFLI